MGIEDSMKFVDDEILKQLVKSRKNSVFASLPNSFVFLPHFHSLIFLAAPLKISTLFGIHIPDSVLTLDSETETHEVLVANALIVENQSNGDEAESSLSRDEVLLRERLRMQSIGIGFYCHEPTTSQILVPTATQLYKLPISLDSNSQIHPNQLQPLVSNAEHELQQQQATYLDAKWAADGRFVAFIRDGELWIKHVQSGLEKQVTFTPQPTDSMHASDLGRAVTSGVAEYVMQEEFSRYSGYWWRPDIESKHRYDVLYLEVDHSKVPIIHTPRISLGKADPQYNINASTVDSYRYPRVGEPNAHSEIRVASLLLPTTDGLAAETDSDDEWTEWSSLKNGDGVEIWSPRVSLSEQFPWAEYVVRAGWVPSNAVQIISKDSTEHPSAAWIWALLLDRKQEKVALVLYMVGESSPGLVIYEESIPEAWINVCDMVRFIPFMESENPDMSKHGLNLFGFQLLLNSEKSGFRHMYSKSVVVSKDPADSSLKLVYDSNLHAITSGNWMVEEILLVDHSKQSVIFTGTRDSVLERHVYAVSLNGSYDMVRLTKAGLMNSSCTVAKVRDDSTFMLVCNASNLCTPPKTMLYTVKLGDESASCVLSAYVMAPSPSTNEAESSPFVNFCRVKPPEQFSFTAPGTKDVVLHGVLYRPEKGTAPFPAAVAVYGGPGVQLVANDYRMTVQMKHQLLADQGVAVIVVDGRGSSRRGLKFESVLKHKMGEIELLDQIEAVKTLSAAGIVDPNRVAIFGWSYGGYMSLLAIMKHSDVFCAAVSGAPVVSWEAYDTAYTERYLGLYDENKTGYWESSVLKYAHGMHSGARGDPERLLVVHGLMDENVHIVHTNSIVNVMIQLNKKYKMMLFPNERHGLRDPAAQLHFEEVFFDFLLARLR